MVGASKHPERDRFMEFKGFLNDLKGWDSLPKEKDKKLTNVQKVQENPVRKAPAEAKPKVNVVSPTDRSEQYSHFKYFDPLTKLPGASSTDDNIHDAASEKELGNEYFKQKRFHEAIECYSRSIVLSPTSVAFANRAMAYLKLKRFQEAETDCTEALNLDDRYVKAYSRRATARKDLGKLKESMEDADFAVRLEPNNPELRKQYTEIKGLYEKEIAKRKSGAGTAKTSVQQSQTAGISMVESQDLKINYSMPSNIQKPVATASKSDIMKHEGSVRKHDAGSSVQDLASRAASRVAATATKCITAPKSAYEFEVSWRSLSEDRIAQTQMLKMIPPSTLPQIFKNALSAPILIDIIKCIGTFIKEDSESAVSILDNMTKIPRFDMIIMCLSAMHRAEVKHIWEVLFLSEDIPINHRETLSRLQSKYCIGEMRDHIFESKWMA